MKSWESWLELRFLRGNQNTVVAAVLGQDCVSAFPPRHPGGGPGSELSMTPKGALSQHLGPWPPMCHCLAFRVVVCQSPSSSLGSALPLLSLDNLTAPCLLPSHCWHLVSTSSLPLPALSLTLVGTCQVTCPRHYGDNWDGVSLAILLPMPGSVPGV